MTAADVLRAMLPYLCPIGAVLVLLACVVTRWGMTQVPADGGERADGTALVVII